MQEEGNEADAEGEGVEGEGTEDAEAAEVALETENGRRMTEETATYRTEARTEGAPLVSWDALRVVELEEERG